MSEIRVSERAVVGAVVGALGLVAACGGGEGAPDATPVVDVCAAAQAGGDAVSFDPDDRLCEKLSSYRFFTDGPAQTPNVGVEPYDLNTPLFSDYTIKRRFVWLPPGTQMTYDAEASFDMPAGAVVLKTFAYADDLREPGGPRRLLETRLLFRAGDVWDVATYVWNEEQTEAELQLAGDDIPATWIHTDGQPRSLEYAVPNKNQCKNCHEETDDVITPIGPKARHINRDFAYPDGVANQLEHLDAVGYLDGLPDLAEVPRAAVWNDPASGTLDERARAWLDINCAHCHNPAGAARTSGLDLRLSQVNPFEYGVCKPPIAAGSGSGGRQYGIVPGAPDESIFMFRLESTEPEIQMPEVGRQLIDEEGVALIREWIATMPGDCGT